MKTFPEFTTTIALAAGPKDLCLLCVLCASVVNLLDSPVPDDPFFLRYFPESRGHPLDDYRRELDIRCPEYGRILDLGCGDNVELSKYRTAHREVWGTDFHRHPELRDTIWFRRLEPDGRIPFDPGAFDLVASSWVLEHVRSPRPFLREIARVLRPGGWFVAVSPNGLHYMTWLRRALGLAPHHYTQRLMAHLYGRQVHDVFPTRYRLNTPAQLQRAAASVGLVLTKWAGFANAEYLRFCEPLRRAAVLTDWFLDRWHPALGRLYLLVTLQKASPRGSATRVPDSRPFRVDSAPKAVLA